MVSAEGRYRAAFAGGRKFSITQSSLFVPSLTVNATRRLRFKVDQDGLSGLTSLRDGRKRQYRRI